MTCHPSCYRRRRAFVLLTAATALVTSQSAVYAQSTTFNGAYIANTTLTGTISINSGNPFNAPNSPTNFENVTLAGTATLNPGQALDLRTPLTFDGGTLRLTVNSQLQSEGPPTSLLGNGQLVVDAGYPPLSVSLVSGGTIGPGITVRVGTVHEPTNTSASFYLHGTTIAGTVLSDVPNGTIFISGYPSTFRNTGTLRAAGGGRILAEYFVNEGAVDVRPGGTFSIANAFTNAGSITASASSTLTFPTGTWSTSGTISSVGANLSLGGAWTNTGTLSAVGGTFTLGTGGATWSNAGTVVATGASVTFAGVTTSVGSYSISNSSVHLAGDFTTAAIRPAAADPTTTVSLAFGEVNNTGDTLTLSSAVSRWHLTGGLLRGGAVTSPDGTPLVATGGNSTLAGVALHTPLAVQAGTVTLSAGTSSAAVSVQAGGTLALANSFVNTGSISLAPGSTLSLAGPFSGSGTITATDAAVRVAGTIGPAYLAAITPSGATTYTVASGGNLTLGGATLWPTPGATWQLAAGGKITGGTVATPIAITGGTLDAVTLAGETTASGAVTVTGSLTLAGDATLRLAGPSTVLSFPGTQSLTGAGTVVFDGGLSAGTVRAPAGGTLTIGPGVTVRTGGGSGTVGFASSGLVNAGTLSAETQGTILTVTGANWMNTGTLRSTNGATLRLAGTFATASLGTLVTDANSATMITGVLDNSNATLQLTGAARLSLGLGGTVRNGSIVSTDGSHLLVYAAPSSQSVLDRVDLDAPVYLLAGANLNIKGTVNRRDITGAGARLVFSDAWSNLGSVDLSNGSTLAIAPSSSLPSSFGSISLTDSTLEVTTVLTTARLNSIARTRTLAMIGSQLTNTGDTLTITEEAGNVRLNQGHLLGGSVVTVGQAALEVYSSGIFDSVTLQGRMEILNGGRASIDATGTGLHVVNARISLGASGNTTNLDLRGPLTGTAEIVFDGDTPNTNPVQNLVNGASGGTVHLTPGIALRTGTNSGRVTASLLNDGAISAQTLARTITLSGATTTNNATFQAANGACLLITGAFHNAGTVTVGPDSLLKLTGTLANNTGTIDLAGGLMLFDYTSSAPTATVRSQLSAARGTGDWEGAAGITSSLAETDTSRVTAIGYAVAADLFGLTGTTTKPLVAGQTADATSLLLKLTRYGDANLDGTIGADDYALLDKGAASGAGVWWLGDFDYDGSVTPADYLLIDTSLAKQQGGHLAPSFLAGRAARFGADYVSRLIFAVPEPSVVGYASFALCVFRRRRRPLTPVEPRKEFPQHRLDLLP